MTLMEFLLARIAEDEEWAKHRDVVTFGLDDSRMNPARVLAECEAKRRIVEAHTSYTDSSGYTTCSECGATVEDWRVDAERAEAAEEGRTVVEWWAFPCRTLKFLALPYADHPDFREEWKP